MATFPTIKEIRAMQAKDLQSELVEHTNALAKMRLEVASGGEKDTAKLRRLRKGIAQMNTVLVEKQNSATVPAPRSAGSASPKNK
jgi:ribosomal protein L29